MTARWLACAVLTLAVLVAPVCAEEGAKPAAPPETAAPAEPARRATPAYAGEVVCAACHTDEMESYGRTPHAAALADTKRPEAERGCEACHGPGQAHVEAGGGKGVGGLRTFAKSEAASRRSAACLGCHGGASRRHDFRSDEHPLSGVACTDCHRLHGGRTEKLLRAETPGLCEGCHLEVRAKFALTERHQFGDQPLDCLECHRPHGSRTRAALRGANDRACFRCHGEYEGPFVFEHEALVTEGCVRCHEPHGSPNRHLLIRQQVAQLCYECHTVTPTNHLQPSYRDCTRCHVDIHGSNVDPHFLEQ
jgi:DmsE family decaheme c-type cytochrome